LYSSPDIIRQVKSRRGGGEGMWHAWERGETCARFWWESPKERANMDEGLDDRLETIWTFRRLFVGVRNGFTWIRGGIIDELL
jgi:hypothetical protein